MAEVAGTLIDTVLRRVRDPGGAAHPRALVRDLLSQVQRLVNAARRDVLVEVAFTTEPNRLVYPMTSHPDLATSIRIEAIRDDDRVLPRVSWESIHAHDHRWFRKVRDQFDAWAPVGRDLFVIYPAKSTASTVTIIATKLTDPLTTDASATELPDQRLPAVRDFVEGLLLARHRLLTSMVPVRGRFTTHLEAE